MPAGGYLRISFPGNFDHEPTSCDVWAIGTDLAYPIDPANRYHGDIDTTTGSSSDDPRAWYCSFKVDDTVNAADQGLAANTPYGISL